jgi:mRNA deadenylase 3'-5' endonuclease subunit Ccr4
MMKDFDYKQLYLNNYKKLPGVAYIVTLVAWLVGSFFGSLALLAEGMIGMAVFVCFVGIVLGLLLASFNRFWCAVIISQRIVVADSMLKMVKNSDNSFNVVNEKPQDNAPEATMSVDNDILNAEKKEYKAVLKLRDEADELYHSGDMFNIVKAFKIYRSISCSIDVIDEIEGCVDRIEKFARRIEEKGDDESLEAALELYEVIANERDVAFEIEMCCAKLGIEVMDNFAPNDGAVV